MSRKISNTSLKSRGLLARLFRPMFRLVTQSWHMLPLGFLFGLGFDTATEISLLGIAATEAAKGVSVSAIMVFPALFAAGMSLVDTTDGVLMLHAYDWAFVKPIRKLYYNLDDYPGFGSRRGRYRRRRGAWIDRRQTPTGRRVLDRRWGA